MYQFHAAATPRGGSPRLIKWPLITEQFIPNPTFLILNSSRQTNQGTLITSFLNRNATSKHIRPKLFSRVREWGPERLNKLINN